jgi:hypothetical protein
VDRTTVTFWTVAWLATTVAGGIFGLIFGCVLGLVIGSVIAGVYAIPIHATAAILTWVFWLPRFRVLTAAFAGGVTGILTTRQVFDPMIFFDSGTSSMDLWVVATLAALCGSFGTGAVCYWHWKATERDSQIVGELGDAHWQFSLRDLFIRFTVVACVLTCWLWILALVRPDSPDAWEPWRELDLPSGTIIENHTINRAGFDTSLGYSLRYESEAAIDVVIAAYNLQSCDPDSNDLTSFIALRPPPWWNVSHIAETYGCTDRVRETYSSLWVDREAKLLYVEVGGW